MVGKLLLFAKILLEEPLSKKFVSKVAKSAFKSKFMTQNLSKSQFFQNSTFAHFEFFFGELLKLFGDTLVQWWATCVPRKKSRTVCRVRFESRTHPLVSRQIKKVTRHWPSVSRPSICPPVSLKHRKFHVINDTPKHMCLLLSWSCVALDDNSRLKCNLCYYHIMLLDHLLSIVNTKVK